MKTTNPLFISLCLFSAATGLAALHPEELLRAEVRFGHASAGDPALTVSALTGGNARAGLSFTGDPNRAYAIALPADGTVKMTNGTGGADRQIGVGNFSSFPSATSVVGTSGSGKILLGATRSALGPTQQPGDYEGTFTVTVVYE